jgi:YVTN family beta-propeller protein
MDRSQRALVSTLALSFWLALAASPALASPFAFVANRGSDDVTVVDLWTATVQATLPTANKPTDLVTSPDGATLYVATDRHLTVIDLRTLDRRDIPYGSALDDGNGIVIHPRGHTVWISHRRAGFLSRVDLATEQVATVAVPGLDVRHLAIHPSGDWIVGVNQVGDVFQLDTATGATAVLFTGAYPLPTGLAVDDQDRVFVASDGSLTVESFEVTGFGSATMPVVEASGFRPGGLTPDGAGHVLVTRPYDDAVFDTWTQNGFGLGGGADPRDVALPLFGLLGATANDGDVTGLAAPGEGSITIVTSTSAGSSLPAGRNPRAVTIGAERGRELLALPSPVRFDARATGGRSTRRVEVVSVGDDEEFIWDVSVDGPDAAAFQVVADRCTHEHLAYQVVCTVDIEFTALPKPLPWWAKFVRVYSPIYRAELVVESHAESDLRIPLEAGTYAYEVNDSVEVHTTADVPLLKISDD